MRAAESDPGVGAFRMESKRDVTDRQSYTSTRAETSDDDQVQHAQIWIRISALYDFTTRILAFEHMATGIVSYTMTAMYVGRWTI